MKKSELKTLIKEVLEENDGVVIDVRIQSFVEEYVDLCLRYDVMFDMKPLYEAVSKGDPLLIASDREVLKKFEHYFKFRI